MRKGGPFCRLDGYKLGKITLLPPEENHGFVQLILGNQRWRKQKKKKMTIIRNRKKHEVMIPIISASCWREVDLLTSYIRHIIKFNGGDMADATSQNWRSNMNFSISAKKLFGWDYLLLSSKKGRVKKQRKVGASGWISYYHRSWIMTYHLSNTPSTEEAETSTLSREN